ncbi:MAG: DUF1707 SHOCT-like domain-containing protein [Mycobacteriales bacterium]
MTDGSNGRVPDDGRPDGSEPADSARAGATGIRISDDERDALVARLTAACGEGRLTLEEFSERADVVYGASTIEEARATVRDLPAAAGAPTGRTSEGGRDKEWHVTPIGGMTRRGRWTLARRTVAVALVGGLDIDAREASLSAPEVEVTHVALIGGVTIVVPPGVRVVLSGFSVLGGQSVHVDADRADAPTIRLRYLSIIGGVSVQTRTRGKR